MTDELVIGRYEVELGRDERLRRLSAMFEVGSASDDAVIQAQLRRLLDPDTE